MYYPLPCLHLFLSQCNKVKFLIGLHEKIIINNSTQPCTNVADARMCAAVIIMVNCDESYMTHLSHRCRPMFLWNKYWNYNVYWLVFHCLFHTSMRPEFILWFTWVKDYLLNKCYFSLQINNVSLIITSTRKVQKLSTTRCIVPL